MCAICKLVCGDCGKLQTALCLDEGNVTLYTCLMTILMGKVKLSCHIHLLSYLLHLQSANCKLTYLLEPPDVSNGLILRRNATVEHVCHRLHRTLVDQFKYALVWGTSSKHAPQIVGIGHVMEDEDVIMIVKKV